MIGQEAVEKMTGRPFPLSSSGGEGRGEEVVFVCSRIFSRLLSDGENIREQKKSVEKP